MKKQGEALLDEIGALEKTISELTESFHGLMAARDREMAQSAQLRAENKRLRAELARCRRDWKAGMRSETE